MARTISNTFTLPIMAAILIGCFMRSSTAIKMDEDDNLSLYGECQYVHPQMHFCMSDFALHAAVDKVIKTVHDNFTGETIQKVKLRVKEVLRSPDPTDRQWPGRKLVKVWVARVKPLVVGESYLLTGASKRKSLHVHKCNWVSEWSQLSRMQYRGVKGRYADNCPCHINTQCLGESGKNICYDDNQNSNNHIKRSVVHLNKQGKESEEDDHESWADDYDSQDDSSKRPRNPFNCPVDTLEGSKVNMDCFAKHAGCYMTTSKEKCRWRNDDEYYNYCINQQWLGFFKNE